jgi:hypothetical protein
MEDTIQFDHGAHFRAGVGEVRCQAAAAESIVEIVIRKRVAENGRFVTRTADTVKSVEDIVPDLTSRVSFFLKGMEFGSLFQLPLPHDGRGGTKARQEPR